MSRVRIEGPRVSVRPFAADFLTQRYVDWLNDPVLMRYSEQRHRYHTLESNQAYAAGFDQQTKFLWAIVDRQDDAHIGNINAYIDRSNGVADIGLLVGDRARQGRGLGGEAWMGVMHALFIVERVRKITGGCAATNASMRRIMERAGMVDDGIRSRQLIIDGIGVDMIHMAKFHDKFSQENSYVIIPEPIGHAT